MMQTLKNRAMREAAEAIIWKLNRKQVNPDGEIVWAKIDRNDVVIRNLQKALEL